MTNHYWDATNDRIYCSSCKLEYTIFDKNPSMYLNCYLNGAAPTKTCNNSTRWDDHMWAGSMYGTYCTACGVNSTAINSYSAQAQPGIPSTLYRTGSNGDVLVPSTAPTFINKCECGSTAVGSDRHSSWCPLYKKD